MNTASKLTLFLLFNLALNFDLHANQFDLSGPSKTQIDYQPFSGLPASSNIKVNVRLNNSLQSRGDDEQLSKRNSSETFRIRFQPSQGNLIAKSKKGNRLPLEFISRQNNSHIRRIGNQYIEDVNLILKKDKRYDFDYTFKLIESQFAKPGIYRLLLDVDMLSLTTNEAVSTQKTITVEVIVDAKLQANIAGTHTQKKGGAKFAIIDFGELETGESEHVSMHIRGNTDASITLESENNGRLKHQAAHNSYVNYSINFDGTTSQLKSPLNIIRGVAHNLTGSIFPIKVTIDNVAGAYSGRYRDIITINVDPY